MYFEIKNAVIRSKDNQCEEYQLYKSQKQQSPLGTDTYFLIFIIHSFMSLYLLKNAFVIRFAAATSMPSLDAAKAGPIPYIVPMIFK